MTSDFDTAMGRVRERVLAAMAHEAAPGVSAALVRGPDIVWSESFGVTDAQRALPIDARTLFSVQSTSKNFTAVAVLIAVQRGLLDLDRPITDYLPDFCVGSRHEANPERRMTLRLLLGHRAGFTHEAPIGNNFESAPPGFEAHVGSISQTWLRYPVGARYAYSNLGIDLAGGILANACGAPFAQCLKTLVFDPLGMPDTTADGALYEAQANRALGHQTGWTSVPARIPMEASGGVYSTSADLARYLAFHLGRGALGGRQILERRLWDEMHTFPASGMAYGLGAGRDMLEFERGQVAMLTHHGGGFGFGSAFYYCPDEQLGWVLLFNRGGWGPPSRLYENFALPRLLAARYGSPAKPQPPAASPIQLPREALDRFVGTYIAGVSRIEVRLEGDGLVVVFPDGAAPDELAFLEADRAYVAAGPHAPQQVRFHAPTGRQSAYFEFDNGATFDRNEGDPAPLGDRYDDRLGRYEVMQWGQKFYETELSAADGLSLGGARLREHLPGLLFSADGEALDLRGEPPTFRNIRLRRLVDG